MCRVQQRTSLCRKTNRADSRANWLCDALPFTRIHHGAGGKELFEVDVDADVFQCLSTGVRGAHRATGLRTFAGRRPRDRELPLRLLRDPPLSGSRRLPCRRALTQPAQRDRAHITAAADRDTRDHRRINLTKRLSYRNVPGRFRIGRGPMVAPHKSPLDQSCRHRPRLLQPCRG